jgi:prophage regulatory protein
MSDVINSRPDGRLLRITQIVGAGNPIPISRSAFYAGIKKGVFPKPYKPSARTSLWKASEIHAAIEALRTADEGGD